MKYKFWLLLGALIFVLVRAWQKVEPFVATHWLYSYEDGFVKRGLVGEIFRVLGITLTEPRINIAAQVLTVTATILFSSLILRSFWKENSNLGLFLFSAVALLSPATLQHIGFEAGRFDTVGVIFLCLAIVVVPRLTDIQSWILTLLLSVISIFAHEAFIFLFVIPLVAFWIYSSTISKRWLLGAVVILISMLTAFFVSVYGLSSIGSYAEHLILMRSRYGEIVDELAIRVLHSTVQENMELTYQKGLTMLRLYNHLLFFGLLLIPGVVLFWKLLKESSSLLRPEEKVLLASSLAPLLLYPFAHDHFRWWSMSITCFFLFMAVLAFNNEGFRAQLEKQMLRHRKLVYFIILISLLVGPVQNTTSFLN